LKGKESDVKVIEALKRIKHVDRKIGKSKQRIKKWCSYVQERDGEGTEPTYDTDDLKKEVQRIGDLVAQKTAIRRALHRTNVETQLEFEGKKRSVDELLIVQKVEIPEKLETLRLFRRLEKRYNDPKEFKVVLQYDPKERDKAVEEWEDKKERLDELLDKSTYEIEVIGLPDVG
jgi:hypothetical protein